eukprot:7432650-Lingulodinium_polyedra.AAC.1
MDMQARRVCGGGTDIEGKGCGCPEIPSDQVGVFAVSSVLWRGGSCGEKFFGMPCTEDATQAREGEREEDEEREKVKRRF